MVLLESSRKFQIALLRQSRSKGPLRPSKRRPHQDGSIYHSDRYSRCCAAAAHDPNRGSWCPSCVRLPPTAISIKIIIWGYGTVDPASYLIPFILSASSFSPLLPLLSRRFREHGASRSQERRDSATSSQCSIRVRVSFSSVKPSSCRTTIPCTSARVLCR